MKRVNIIFNDIKDALGLSVNEYYILDYMFMNYGNHPWAGVNPGDVGKILGIPKAAGIKLIEKLCSDGFIEMLDGGPCMVTEKWKGNYSEDVKDFYRQVFKDSDTWDYVWSVWVKYKKEQHKFVFKNEASENIAKEHLYNLSGGDLNIAKAIVKRSMAQGWMGLVAYSPGDGYSKNNMSQQIAGTQAVEVFKKEARKAKNTFLNK